MRILITAGLAYTILTFAVAYTWNLIIFPDIYAGLTLASHRPGPIIPLGVAAILSQALAITALFHFVYAQRPGLGKAIALSLTVGIMDTAYAAFTVPAKFIIDPIATYVSLELAFGVVHYGLVGLAFFFIFGKKPAMQ